MLCEICTMQDDPSGRFYAPQTFLVVLGSDVLAVEADAEEEADDHKGKRNPPPR
jgi:hypothetical protein